MVPVLASSLLLMGSRLSRGSPDGMPLVEPEADGEAEHRHSLGLWGFARIVDAIGGRNWIGCCPCNSILRLTEETMACRNNGNGCGGCY